MSNPRTNAAAMDVNRFMKTLPDSDRAKGERRNQRPRPLADAPLKTDAAAQRCQKGVRHEGRINTSLVFECQRTIDEEFRDFLQIHYGEGVAAAIVTAWPPRTITAATIGGGKVDLEEDFRGELNLPRRAGIAGREPRVADDAERRAAHRRRAARLAEIRLVEQVEDLDAKLYARAALQRHVLDDREVGIAESRAVEHVASEVSE